MTDTQLPYPWHVDNFQAMPLGQDQFDQPFIASDFPLAVQEVLDSSWAAEQFHLINTYQFKTSTGQPYPQSWYEAGLVRQDCGMNQDTSLQPPSEETPTNLYTNQLATERALFMTPSPQLAFPFPASPTSDAHSSPEPSHASTSAWEGEIEDAHYTHLDFVPSLATQFQSPTQIASPNGISALAEAEDCFTPLEMPDGSSRLTSNWLPVDPEAGFTIGSPMMPDETRFQDLHQAFFQSEPAAWSYDR